MVVDERAEMLNDVRDLKFFVELFELFDIHFVLVLEMCSVSTNGEQASLANLKLTIGSL